MPGRKDRPAIQLKKITVWAVGPRDHDHSALIEILKSKWEICPETRWDLKSGETLGPALEDLRKGVVPIVICESNLGNSDWKHVLEQLEQLPDPPMLIVTSRIADERLWAEALNLGAYDVLPKPFETAEVMRTFAMAWIRWNLRRQYGTPTHAVVS